MAAAIQGFHTEVGSSVVNVTAGDCSSTEDGCSASYTKYRPIRNELFLRRSRDELVEAECVSYVLLFRVKVLREYYSRTDAAGSPNTN
jgi:hypothetical protein